MEQSIQAKVLLKTIVNPVYKSGLKHGLQSVRLFYATTPFFVHIPHHSLLDIPVLGLQGIMDKTVIQALLAASTPMATVPNPPEGEMLVACPKCHNISWAISGDQL